MPHVTFIYPCVGRCAGQPYIRSWQMQPLAIAVLAGLTSKDWERAFFDDRMEMIDYSRPTDLVAISIETFTARRAYQIAAEYRKRGVPVIMGGYHATFCPDEVLEHADAVCVGEAEGVWARVLEDVRNGQLRGRYTCPASSLAGIRPDRSIFGNKRYFKLALVETSRGCSFRCNFCSITAFHKASYRRRPVDEVVAEIKRLDERMVFFVDDNVIGNPANSKAFLAALKPLAIRWIGQASLNVAADPELLDLLVDSGCIGLLLGVESLSTENLSMMNKPLNVATDYKTALGTLRKRGIIVYGAFMFGLVEDSPELIAKTVRFAVAQKMFIAAFAQMIPFPGTPFYDELAADNRLLYPHWWLHEDYRFGDAPYEPTCMTAGELGDRCFQARREFYGLGSIMRRASDFSANLRNWRMAANYLSANLMLRREISQRRGLPLGVREADGTDDTGLKGGYA